METQRAWQALGRVSYSLTEQESKSRRYRRSIYVSQDISAGTLFSEENIRVIRPGLGLPPKHYSGILGRRASKAIEKGTPLCWECVE